MWSESITKQKMEILKWSTSTSKSCLIKYLCKCTWLHLITSLEFCVCTIFSNQCERKKPRRSYFDGYQDWTWRVEQMICGSECLGSSAVFRYHVSAVFIKETAAFWDLNIAPYCDFDNKWINCAAPAKNERRATFPLLPPPLSLANKTFQQTFHSLCVCAQTTFSKALCIYGISSSVCVCPAVTF